MPSLDMSEALTGSDICSFFSVTRRLETVGEDGISTYVLRKRDNISGVITAAGPNDLERLPEEDRTGQIICIVTRFKLRATSPGYKPDIISWLGSNYLVKKVDNYPQYGRGFVQVIAGSMESQDPPSAGNADDDIPCIEVSI